MAALVTYENVSLCYIKIIYRYKNAASYHLGPVFATYSWRSPFINSSIRIYWTMEKSDYSPLTPLTKVTWFQLARGPGECQEEAQVHVPQP